MSADKGHKGLEEWTSTVAKKALIENTGGSVGNV